MGLGLNMNLRKPLLGIGLFVMVLAGSCMQKPDLSEDNGPQATPQEVQQALIAAWGGADPLDMKVDEFVGIDKEVIIEAQPPRLVLQDGKTISRAEDQGADRVFTILQQSLEINGEQQNLSTSERTVAVEKSVAASHEISPMNAALPLSLEKMQQLFLTCVPSAEWKVACHNLKVSEETVPAPAAVAGRVGCEGLTNCQWRKKVVSFDMIVDFLDPETNTRSKVKQVYTIKMSHDAPFLSRITDMCFQGVGTFQGTPYLATVCEKVVNFRRGGN